MTWEQMSLLDLPAATEAREDGIAQADANADDDWREVATHVVDLLAGTGEPFTADHVVAMLEELWPEVTTHNLAALGPVFKRAARDGSIVKTGRLVPSRIARRHRDLVEWCGR